MNDIFFTYEKEINRNYTINTILIFLFSLIALEALLWFFVYRKNNVPVVNTSQVNSSLEIEPDNGTLDQH